MANSISACNSLFSSPPELKQCTPFILAIDASCARITIPWAVWPLHGSLAQLLLGYCCSWQAPAPSLLAAQRVDRLLGCAPAARAGLPGLCSSKAVSAAGSARESTRPSAAAGASPDALKLCRCQLQERLHAPSATRVCC